MIFSLMLFLLPQGRFLRLGNPYKNLKTFLRYVCGSITYREALLMCESIGYYDVTKYVLNQVIPRGSFSITNVKCSSDATRFDECTYTTNVSQCGMSDGIYLECGGPTNQTISVHTRIQCGMVYICFLFYI